jgi:hypothetical protein
MGESFCYIGLGASPSLFLEGDKSEARALSACYIDPPPTTLPYYTNLSAAECRATRADTVSVSTLVRILAIFCCSALQEK